MIDNKEKDNNENEDDLLALINALTANSEKDCGCSDNEDMEEEEEEEDDEEEDDDDDDDIVDIEDIEDDSDETMRLSSIDSIFADNLPSRGKLCRTKIRGKFYMVPDVSENPDYYVRDITLNLDRIDRQLGSKVIRVDHLADDKHYASVTLEGNFNDDYVAHPAIGFYLYREGCERPLSYGVVNPSYHSETWSFSDTFRILSPARYFILCENIKLGMEYNSFIEKDFPILPFTILNHGERMPRLSVVKAKVKKNSNADNRGRYTRVRLALTFDRRVTCNRRVFTAVCVDSDAMMLIADVVNGSIDAAGSNDVTFTFSTNGRVWLDGLYAFYVMTNGMPGWRVDMRVEDSVFNVTGVTAISRDSEGWCLTKALAGLGPIRTLMMMPGYTAVKRFALECKKNIDRMHVDNNYYNRIALVGTLTGDIDLLAKEVARYLYGSEPDTILDCEEISSRRERNNGDDADLDLLPTASDETVVLKNVGALRHQQMINIGARIERWLREYPSRRMVLVATPSDMTYLREFFPVIAGSCHLTCTMGDDVISGRDAMVNICRAATHENLRFADEAVRALTEKLRYAFADAAPGWTLERAMAFVSESVQPRYFARVYQDAARLPKRSPAVQSSDIDFDKIVLRPVDEYQESMQRLNSLIGLAEIKEQLRRLLDLSRFERLRANAGICAERQTNYHMVFSGSPGTGKTTAAKCIGQALHSVGVLSKGDVVVVDRGSLVGRFIGDTEDNMRKVLVRARGNVLFIDEAYTLVENRSDSNDFGRKAIDCLLTELCRPNPDMVVIMAGYEKEMDRMLESNTGLRSRFPLHMRFPDYTPSELTDIAAKMLTDEKYAFTDDARTTFHNLTEQFMATPRRGFSNGRWVEQMIHHHILPAMVERVMAGKTTDITVLTTVEVPDVERGFVTAAGKPAPGASLGFR